MHNHIINLLHKRTEICMSLKTCEVKQLHASFPESCRFFYSPWFIQPSHVLLHNDDIDTVTLENGILSFFWHNFLDFKGYLIIILRTYPWSTTLTSCNDFASRVALLLEEPLPWRRMFSCYSTPLFMLDKKLLIWWARKVAAATLKVSLTMDQILIVSKILT